MITCDAQHDGVLDDRLGRDVAVHWNRREALDADTDECSCRGAGKHRVVRYEAVMPRRRR